MTGFERETSRRMIQNLFSRCFNIGHDGRNNRPSHRALDAEQTVEIKINVQIEPVAICTQCSTNMATRSKDGLIWFWCRTCNEGVFTPEANIRRDASRALFDPSFTIRTWKFKSRELGLEPPDFDFE